MRDRELGKERQRKKQNHNELQGQEKRKGTIETGSQTKSTRERKKY